MWRRARPALTSILAVDVDGVLLDPDRAGLGSWGTALQDRLGIDRGALREAFFAPYWDEIVVGRRPIEPALEHALRSLGSSASVNEVLECWFTADFVGAGTLLDDDPSNVEVARQCGWGGVVFAGQDAWTDDVQRALDERGRLPG